MWKIRSMEIEECGKWGVCGNAKCGKCGVCGNALTLTDLFISKHFNAFIQHNKNA